VLTALLLIIGVVGGLVAAAMAWLITYEEYVKHFPADHTPAVWAALQTAAVTFAFFVGLAAALGWVLTRMLSGA
jgi:hypothetical protein